MSTIRASSLALVLFCATLVANGVCGCGFRDEGSGPPAPQPQQPQQIVPAPLPPATPPASPPGQQPEAVVIAPGGGLSGMQVQVDGRPVWPPQGPGCDQLVACCRDGTAIDSSIGLACQLSMAIDGATCPNAMASVRSSIAEMGRAVPPSCLGGTP
jgi:hypothetical protein